jgi:type I restriction enzyme R subunit
VHPKASPNFAYLAYHDTRLVALATQAEEYFATDPPVAIAKLRLFAEVLAKRAAARVALLPEPNESQQALVDRLFDARVIGAVQRDIFHSLRRAGNAAVHEDRGTASEALLHLRMARELAVWFQRTFGNNRKFEPGPFIPPAAPTGAAPSQALDDELTRLRSELAAHAKEAAEARAQVEAIRAAAEKEARERLSAEERLAKAKEEASIWEALASEQVVERERTAAARKQELEAQNRKLLEELARVQAAAAATPTPVVQATIDRANAASEAIELDEAATRRLIDEQLRAAGWEADSAALTFESGARPTRGKNLAIAEWPTLLDGKHGRADYVLFAGLQVLGVVEAKRKHRDVPGVIPQAMRYSRGYVVQADEVLPEGSPWCRNVERGEPGFKVPFLFATNGRGFLRQLQQKSGIWFLDVRRTENHPTALEGWYSPDGLLDLLRQDVDAAHERLKVEPMPYIDREYQRSAILAVEKNLEQGKRELLVAMATGTGKTRTCIGLVYRLLKTRRFRRVLFLVDREALGTQTADALKTTRLEQLQAFTDIFDVKELGDLKPDRDTRLHIATVQAMAKRVLGPHDDRSERDIPCVDQYDCIIVDECHRGYLLDRELSDREFTWRNEADYISKYRRVLDHFDAVKIGLTATPALHTTEIFGPPVFSYSYREAVVDGYLVDHEPPIRIVTRLAKDGIRYEAKEEVLVLDRKTQTVAKETLPDEVSFEVDAFNRRVITPAFNRAVLRELVKHIDPEQDEKTLIFCVNDEHADLVVTELNAALADRYGSVDHGAVAKITGKADDPNGMIRRFRNERYPNIVVTVDLLTTGVDVPRIANLVFLRRVRSRILYEQMLGRATRLCPEISKERFRIFDAVDLYAELQDMTDMKPVVVNPFVTFEQLAKEVLEGGDDEAQRESADEFLAKLQRKKRFIKGESAERVEAAAGMPLEELTRLLRASTVAQVVTYLRDHPSLATALDRTTGSTGYKTIVSEKDDEVREVTRGYGKHGSRPPGDYLEAFRGFIESHANKIPALLVVTQRPRDLTREDLRMLKLTLDEHGFTESCVQTAWREQRNEDVAATIIGYIRQLALGSPLVPYAERVDSAVQRLRKAHKFTEPQVKWLDRIAKQVKLETVVDRAAFEAGQFKADGGFARLNKVFDGKLESLLGELADEVWKDAG